MKPLPNLPESLTNLELRENGDLSPETDVLAVPTYVALLATGEMGENGDFLPLQLPSEDKIVAIQSESGEAGEPIPLEATTEVDPETGKRRPITGLLATSLGLLMLSGTMVTTFRGGNYKVVRQNLQASGKANAKEPMSKKQKRLRRRKGKK